MPKEQSVITAHINMSGHNKKELVELITKQKTKGFLEYVGIAGDPERGAIRITPEEVDTVYQEVQKFKQNRSAYSRKALQYYSPAFTSIEECYKSGDFEGFRKGLDTLLGLIGDD